MIFKTLMRASYIGELIEPDSYSTITNSRVLVGRETDDIPYIIRFLIEKCYFSNFCLISI